MIVNQPITNIVIVGECCLENNFDTKTPTNVTLNTRVREGDAET